MNRIYSSPDDDIDVDALSRVDAVLTLQSQLLEFATGGSANEDTYQRLRRRLTADPMVGPKLPQYVRVCHTLRQFWPQIQKAGGYKARREQLWNDFGALILGLEGAAPADSTVSDTLKALSESEVHSVWARALERRSSDPEAAITSARTLLESTCKHILDEESVEYADKADLPKLYGLTARALKLAPDQHTEQIFKQILGGCHRGR